MGYGVRECCSRGVAIGVGVWRELIGRQRISRFAIEKLLVGYLNWYYKIINPKYRPMHCILTLRTQLPTCIFVQAHTGTVPSHPLLPVQAERPKDLEPGPKVQTLLSLKSAHTLSTICMVCMMLQYPNPSRSEIPLNLKSRACRTSSQAITITLTATPIALSRIGLPIS